MPDIDKKPDKDKFNETLKRMLKTPPKPKQEPEKVKDAAAPGKKVKRPTGES